MADERKFYESISDIIGQSEISAPAPHSGSRWISGRSIKRLLIMAGVTTVALLCILGAGDYLRFRYLIATHGNAFGMVTVDRFYSIAEKNNRTEFNYAGSETQTCVHALLPHAGARPCWYVSRHRDQSIAE